jgi:putative DNA primase/helicase
MQVRHLNHDYFKFYPQFKLTISGNYRPLIQGTDEGIWRRVLLVPWNVQVASDEQDRQLGEKLRAEAPGVLNRLLDGLCDWLDNGLLEPQEVTAATATYRSDSDPLGRFISACLSASAGDREQSSSVHDVFKAWARANGEREWSNKGMTGALRERGYQSKHSDVNWWLDVRLIKRALDFVDHDGNPIRRNAKDADGST